jgi:hypothetical protein
MSRQQASLKVGLLPDVRGVSGTDRDRTRPLCGRACIFRAQTRAGPFPQRSTRGSTMPPRHRLRPNLVFLKSLWLLQSPLGE